MAQRRGWDRAVIIVIRREMSVIEVFRIFDNVRDSLSLRGPRWRWSDGGRPFRRFGKVTSRIFAHLGLGRIASGYSNHLHEEEDCIRHRTIGLRNKEGI
jgi:hypothetical protein